MSSRIARLARLHALTALILPAMLLAGCDSGGTTGGPGAVSEGEARAIDDAAEMLDQRRLPDGVLPPTGADALAGEGAETDNSTGEGSEAQ